MSIELPWFPSELRPNSSKRHWRSKQGPKEQYRHDCYYLTKQLWREPVPEGNIHLSIVYYPPSNRAIDLDNCLSASKVLIDAFSSALGINDSRFRPITIDMGEVREHGAVLVRFINT